MWLSFCRICQRGLKLRFTTAHCSSWPVFIGYWAERNTSVHLLMVPSGGGPVPASKEAFGIGGGDGGGGAVLCWCNS